VAASADPAFELLLVHLRDERGFDFTGYKRASLERRVRRRMESLSIDSFESYHDFLLVHQDELTALFNTILINVTSFFRDLDAWTYLEEQLLPELLRHREGQPLRAWCAGCASGEEAYTLAMVLAEVMGLEDFRDRVKIYATDVDEDALTHARHATYTVRELNAVPEPLREKYFEPVGSRFAFRKELRRSVIFGRNDIVQDAPISHVDILTCRNTLMYLNAATQMQVLNRMHFALRPEGILFLGKAEMLLSHSSYFRAIELKRRFFRKIPTEPRDRRSIMAPGANDVPGTEELDTSLLRHAALMQSPAAQIALDQEGRLALCNNRAIHLFGLSQRDIGRPIQDLEMSYRPIELRSHIDEALHQRRAIWVRDVTLHRGPAEQLSIDIQFIPLSGDNGTPLGVTVIFNDVTEHRQLQNDLQYANRKLETAYEELQSTNEELETTNEELQSTVEELETTNEELQSTNEELETMNEELQSMNDEMQFGNEALRDRQDELDRLNDFMSSVLGSMNSGVIVVDSKMEVLAWNLRAEDLWGVRSDEAVGTHLFDLDIGLPFDKLRRSIGEQLGPEPPEPATATVKAVNRRGRAIEVKVTLTHLDRRASPPAAMLVMDVLHDE
jgi:two-component system, chemotaxis family, CheB/CheR fusion protein